jgi:hypothetical protein
MMKREEIVWTQGLMPVTLLPWFQTKKFGMVVTVIDCREYATMTITAPFGKNYQGSRLHLRVEERCVGEDMVDQAKERGIRRMHDMLVTELERRRTENV